MLRSPLTVGDPGAAASGGSISVNPPAQPPWSVPRGGGRAWQRRFIMFLFSSWSAAPISLPSPHLSISPGCTADPPCRWLGTPAPGSLAVPVPCSAVISNSLAVHALYSVPVHNLYTTGIQPVPHSSPLFPSVTPSLTCTPLPIHYAGVRRTRAHLECHIGVPCSAETSNSMAVPTLFDIWGFVAVPISPPNPFLLPLSPLPSPPSC